ncbi:MAG: phospholipase D family protein [Pseudomonadota bacterium]
MNGLTARVFFCLLAWLPFLASAAPAAPMLEISRQIAAHAGQSGVHVLDTGTEALLTRAWLVDHAKHSIEVQYFIWSTDNIGILAADALLRAAERGVRVRVIVDDLMIDAPDKSLLALARHPNIDIRIYNPRNSVGISLPQRLLNVITDFRGVNQRMHDKTFVVDGLVAITGGRNLAAEYYDYNHNFNFRDRDVLLLGDVVKDMQASFERFWASQLSVAVEALYEDFSLMRMNVRADDTEIRNIYRDLHAYAGSPENFAPEIRAAIDAARAGFRQVADQLVWGHVEFISDLPGKNDGTIGFGGGGRATTALAQLVGAARSRIVIQSPYLVLSDKALALFRKARARGVRIRINTNSLASTDNIHAFSGYRNQREELLGMGFEIYEYKPYPAIQRRLMQRFAATKNRQLVFGMHAKTMVIDGQTTFIGTFNLDPRSENLNTEAGVVIRNDGLARKVEAAIEVDMEAENSWNAATDDPDRHVSLMKRIKVRFWQWMPLKPLL